MTWPPVFDGIGALVVRCDLDPAALAARIPSLTWIAPKVNGDDITGPAEIVHAVEVWRGLGLQVGSWGYCSGPPAVDAHSAYPNYYAPAFIVYDVEAEYKTDTGAPADWPAQLVAEHRIYSKSRPAAVTSYGAIPGYGNFPSSIDFRPFVEAGWPIIAQAYDGFTVPHARTYTTTSSQTYPGPYPAAGVHTMVRSLQLVRSQAVYRPESIDS